MNAAIAAVAVLGALAAALSFLIWAGNERVVDNNCSLFGMVDHPNGNSTAGGMSPAGCVMNTRSVDVLVVPLLPQMDRQSFYPIWYPQVGLASAAVLPWIVVAVEATTRRRADRAASSARKASSTPLALAIVVTVLLGTAALLAWPVETRIAEARCVAGSYTQPGRPGAVTGQGCRLETAGADRITAPTFNQFHLLQVSALLTVLAAVPPSVLVVRRRRRRTTT